MQSDSGWLILGCSGTCPCGWILDWICVNIVGLLYRVPEKACVVESIGC